MPNNVAVKSSLATVMGPVTAKFPGGSVATGASLPAGATCASLPASLASAAPPSSSAVAAHTHAANAPADVQICAPFWPFGHTHTTLMPGMHVSDGLVPLQPPTSVAAKHESTRDSLVAMGTIVAQPAPSHKKT